MGGASRQAESTFLFFVEAGFMNIVLLMHMELALQCQDGLPFSSTDPVPMLGFLTRRLTELTAVGPSPSSSLMAAVQGARSR